jgi:hypothetical protein
MLMVVAAALSPAVGDDTPERGFVHRLVGQTDNLRPEVLELALSAYAEGLEEGSFSRERLTVIDYSLPSYEERLWVIDFDTMTVLYEEIVAHGMGSPTYIGKHGYTLRLDGLEEGVNDNARDRLIVIHGAHYVTEDRADDRMVGRSWGCPVVRPEISRELIDAIKDGSALWIYYPDDDWLDDSEYLDAE